MRAATPMERKLGVDGVQVRKQPPLGRPQALRLRAVAGMLRGQGLGGPDQGQLGLDEMLPGAQLVPAP